MRLAILETMPSAIIVETISEALITPGALKATREKQRFAHLTRHMERINLTYLT
jgi:hypothetical protein